MIPTQSISKSNTFQAHWDASFGNLQPTTLQKICRVAWDIFCMLTIFPALIRWCLSKIILPASSPWMERKYNEQWLDDKGSRAEYLAMAQRKTVTITTPDGALLNVHCFSRIASEANASKPENIPAIIYFNPNCATSFRTVRSSLLDAKAKELPSGYNVVFFDYRGTGNSPGSFRSFDDLVIDGASVVQWVKEALGTPRNQIHLYGYSLGGAVANYVQALVPPGETPGKLINDRSFSSTDDMVDEMLKEQNIILRTLAGNAVKGFMRPCRLAIDSADAFRRTKGDRLVIRHPFDNVIPEQASLEKHVQSISHKVYELASEYSTAMLERVENKESIVWCKGNGKWDDKNTSPQATPSSKIVTGAWIPPHSWPFRPEETQMIARFLFEKNPGSIDSNSGSALQPQPLGA